MSKYLIITEPTDSGYSAYSPDVLGCVATGSTEAEVTQNMLEALEFHFEGMREDGEAIPEPKAHAHYLEPAV